MSMLSLPARPESHLRQDRADLLAELEAQEKSVRGRAMTKAEKRDWDKTQDQIDDLTDQIEQQVRKKERMARKADARVGPYFEEREGKNLMGDIAFGVATGRLETRDGINFSNGSAVVETDNVRDEIIHQLTATNRLSQLGARIVTMENYQVFPKVDQNPNVQHWESGDQIQADNAMVISSRATEFKTAAILVKADKPLLMDSGERGRKLIGDAIMNQMNETFITSALHGNNANKEPNGLDNISGVLSIDGSGAAITDYNLHLDACASLMAKNVQQDRIGYIHGTRSWRQTAGLVGTDGQPLMAPKAIGDLRNFHTTGVLENYGVGEDETRLYFGDFSNLIIGLGGTFKMELAEKYADTLQTAFLVWMRYDIQVLRPDNFCIVENLATS